MTIEGFRPCSAVPLGAALADEGPPCAIAPFTGASAAALALCCGGTPVGAGEACVAVVVALAERAGSCAGTAPEKGVEAVEGALESREGGVGLLLGGIALLMRRRRGWCRR